MKLISLQTQGFKRLRNHTFNFTDGLNVIVGDNAAGKSTLLQAIECALYGAAVVPGKKEHMITWGQKTWKIVLEFAVGGAEYQLTRSKSTAKLERLSGYEIEREMDFDIHPDKKIPKGKRVDEKWDLVANGATPVTQAIEELLGLSTKDYNLFMQSKQGETSGVLTFGAAALNRKVESFSGISTIDDVHQLALEDHRNAKAKIDALSFDPADLDILYNDLAAAESTTKELWFDVEATRQALEAAPRPEDLVRPVSDPDAMQKQRDTLYRLQQRLIVAKREAATAENYYGEAAQRLEEMEQPEAAEELQVSIRARSKQVKEAAAEVNRLNAELNEQQRLFTELSEVEELFDSMRTEDAIGEELAEAVSLSQELTTAGKDLAKQEHELGYRVQQLEGMLGDSECPTCGTKLSEHDPEKLRKEREEILVKRSEVTTEIVMLDKRIAQANVAVAKLEKELESYQLTEAKVDKLRDRLADLGVVLGTGETPTEGQLKRAKETHQELMGDLARLEHQAEQVESAQRRYNSAKRAAEKALSEHKQAANSVDEIQHQLAEAESAGSPSDEDIAHAREQWKLYEKRVSDTRIRLAEAKADAEQSLQRWESSCKDLERVKGDVERLEKRADELKEVKVMADKAARLAKFLGERRAGYLQEVWDAVLGAASKQVNLASRGMVSRLAFKDGDFFFEEEGVLAPVSSASGAQKAHIGVAVRIGLSRALYGKDALLIFDEPTESMREHHAIGLSSSLAGAASQCLLITHREQDQDLASNVVDVS